MKKSKVTTSLLASAAAIAGLGMGASLARAATYHPAVPLYTYEEVAAQFGYPAMQVQVNPVPNTPGFMKGMPYSPKQTCSGADMPNQAGVKCHGGYAGYSKLADHAFHAALGFNEWMDNDPSGKFVDANGIQTGLNPQKPWLQSHGHNGKW